MNSLCWMLFISIVSFNPLSAQETTIKVKTTPDFPKGLPPQAILWNGYEIGTTNPGKSVSIAIDLSKNKKNLSVGSTTVSLWKSGLRIKGEVLSGKAKMKKGPTIEIKSKLSAEEVLLNAMDYFPTIQEKLNSELPVQEKVMYSRLLANVLNYEFTTENIVATITGTDQEYDKVYLSFSYFGPVEKSWNDTLQVTEAHFSGKKPNKGKRAQVFVEHFNSIPKYGILKLSREGELELTAIKTEKYKWGTYKKKKGKKKKHILPLTFYSR